MTMPFVKPLKLLEVYEQVLVLHGPVHAQGRHVLLAA